MCKATWKRHQWKDDSKGKKICKRCGKERNPNADLMHRIVEEMKAMSPEQVTKVLDLIHPELQEELRRRLKAHEEPVQIFEE